MQSSSEAALLVDAEQQLVWRVPWIVYLLRCRDGSLYTGITNDLHRRLFPYLGFPLLARLLGVHRLVREDGQLSIARSFRPGEWRTILADAGIPEGAARICRHFPFRLCVERLF